jgi:hypothetical protein
MSDTTTSQEAIQHLPLDEETRACLVGGGQPLEANVREVSEKWYAPSDPLRAASRRRRVPP